MFSQRRILHTIKLFKEAKRWQTRSTQIPIGDSVMEIVAGDMAQFADGSATVTIGDTEVLGTVVGKDEPSPSSFLPLTVDFTQAFSTAGVDILSARMIDRSIRPMFSKEYRCETQVVCSVVSRDKSRDPVVASINAASAALSLSNVPWNGPVGAVQVGLIGNDVVINPTKEMLEASQLNMIISATEENKIVMVDGAANIVPVPLVERAIQEGVVGAQKIISAIRDFASEFGKVKKDIPLLGSLSDELKQKIDEMASAEIEDYYKNLFHDKIARDKTRQAHKLKVITVLKESDPACDANLVGSYLDQLGVKIFRNITMKSGRRWAEIRGDNEIRILSHKVDLNPSLHGSSLFQRGGTQVRATLTFEPPHFSYTSPFPLSGSSNQNFFLHYNFPAYATNETGRMVHGRREVGHGALASKGIKPIIPPNYEFAIRIDSVVQQSSGSSSMASVCAGSLALQDAGVPILEPVSGVAMGIMSEENQETGKTETILLTDISGIEDALGDMDFKVAGTKKGLTAMQLDTKLQGMPTDLVFQAIRRAQVANSDIIDDMKQTISRPSQHKENRPVTETVVIPTSKRAKFLGINRSNVKSISEETGVTIAAIDDSTSEFQIFAPNKSSMKKALEIIEKNLGAEEAPKIEQGSLCRVKIIELKENGIFVQLHATLPEVFIPNSLLDRRKGITPAKMGYKVSQDISVKYHGKDPVTGRIRLSKRDLEPTYC